MATTRANAGKEEEKKEGKKKEEAAKEEDEEEPNKEVASSTSEEEAAEETKAPPEDAKEEAPKTEDTTQQPAKKEPIFYGPKYGCYPSTSDSALMPIQFKDEIDRWAPNFFGPTTWGLVDDALPTMFPPGRVFLKIEQLLQAAERLLERFGRRKVWVRKVAHYHCFMDLREGTWKIHTEVINPKPRHYYLKIVTSELDTKGTTPNNVAAPAEETNLEAWVAARVTEEDHGKAKTQTYVESPYLPADRPSFAIPCLMLFSSHFSDISIECGGDKGEKTTIPAHRVILGMASPHWHHVFVSSPAIKVLTLPYPPVVVKEVLSVLYQGTINCQILENHLATFRKFSTQYQVECIPKLIHHLAYRLLTFDNIRERLLNFVHVHDVKLIEVALTFVEKHAEHVIVLPDITTLASDHPEIWEKLVPVAVKDKKVAEELLSQEPAAKKRKLQNEFNTHRNPIIPPSTAPFVAPSTAVASTAVAAVAAAPTTTDTKDDKDDDEDEEDASKTLEWQGEVIFPGQLSQSSASPMINVPQAFQEMNILSYLNPLYKGMRIAFDPSKYPPGTAQFSKDNPGWVELKKDILAAGRNAGQELREASLQKGTKRTVAFNCQRSRHYPKELSVHKDRDSTDYRKDNNNKRSRNGRRLPKNTQTSKPTRKDRCCPFRFNLGVDKTGFYLSCGTGTMVHKFHPKLAPGEKMPKSMTKEAFPHLRDNKKEKE